MGIPSLNYSFSAPVIVIVMVALAEELFVTLVVSLLGVPVAATEIVVPPSVKKINSTSKLLSIISTLKHNLI